MYNLAESLRSALTAIRAHAFRSFLTTLGIIIAVMAVISVVALIQGFSSSVTSTFASMGANGLTIYSYQSNDAFFAGKNPKVTTRDLNDIQHQVSGISSITPVLQLAQFGGTVQYHGQTTYAGISGTTSEYAYDSNIYPVLGRYITPSDDLQHRRVAVIGKTVVTELHMPDNPVGEYVQMYGQWFKVIGVLKELGSILGNDQDDQIYVPYGTARSLLGTAADPDIQIDLNVNDVREIDAIEGRIQSLLRRDHHLKDGEDDDFKVQTAAQLADSIGQIFNAITVVLGGIVGISLLVGGIGIMNIMLVSVTERTREIGILKSLGARRSDILLQFLIEALVLCMLGGIIGIGLGYGIGQLVAHAIPAFLGAHVPWWAVVLAFGFSAGTGIIFGIVPAAKAAALDPIEALRYE